MLSFCLALTDLLGGRDQNESPAPSSSLAFSSSSSTDSFSSLALPQSSLVPWPEPTFSSSQKRRRENGDEKGDEEVETRAERMNIFLLLFSSLWPALKDFLPLTHAHTNLSLSVLFHTWGCLLCVLSANFRGDFLEGTKNSMSPSMAGTCLLRQMLSFGSPH